MLVLALVVLAALVVISQLVAVGPARRRRLRTPLVRPAGLPRDPVRWTAAAVAVGFALRLAWVIATTVNPQVAFGDTGRYLYTAIGLADGHLPTNLVAGGPSAGSAIGYPALLAPFLWVTDHLGIASPAFTAALLNVAAGTLSIVLLAAITRRWLGSPAAVVAAWMLALFPGQIYVTSTALAETVFTALLLGGIWAGTRLTDSPRTRSRDWVMFGAFVGLAALTNAGGIMLLAVPVLTRRTQGARWRDSLVRPGYVLLGLAVLFVPWTVRNGAQVGVWSPMPTSNAMAICVGNWEGADGSGFVGGNDVVSHCFTDEPAAPGTTAEENFQAWLADPDEADWYYRNNREALAFALSHPLDEVRLVPLKLWAALRDDDETLGAAKDLGNHDIAGAGVENGLLVTANLYYWAVLVSAGAGIVAVRAVRRATPVWGVALLNLAGVIVFHGHGRYHHAVIAILCFASAGALVAVVGRGDRPDLSPASRSTPVDILGR